MYITLPALPKNAEGDIVLTRSKSVIDCLIIPKSVYTSEPKTLTALNFDSATDSAYMSLGENVSILADQIGITEDTSILAMFTDSCMLLQIDTGVVYVKEKETGSVFLIGQDNEIYLASQTELEDIVWYSQDWLETNWATKLIDQYGLKYKYNCGNMSSFDFLRVRGMRVVENYLNNMIFFMSLNYIPNTKCVNFLEMYDASFGRIAFVNETPADAGKAKPKGLYDVEIDYSVSAKNEEQDSVDVGSAFAGL